MHLLELHLIIVINYFKQLRWTSFENNNLTVGNIFIPCTSNLISIDFRHVLYENHSISNVLPTNNNNQKTTINCWNTCQHLHITRWQMLACVRKLPFHQLIILCRHYLSLYNGAKRVFSSNEYAYCLGKCNPWNVSGWEILQCKYWKKNITKSTFCKIVIELIYSWQCKVISIKLCSEANNPKINWDDTHGMRQM